MAMQNYPSAPLGWHGYTTCFSGRSINVANYMPAGGGILNSVRLPAFIRGNVEPMSCRPIRCAIDPEEVY